MEYGKYTSSLIYIDYNTSTSLVMIALTIFNLQDYVITAMCGFFVLNTTTKTNEKGKHNACCCKLGALKNTKERTQVLSFESTLVITLNAFR